VPSPFRFTAMTMKSVGVAANEMVKEVARQFESAMHVGPLSKEAIEGSILAYKTECCDKAGRDVGDVKHSAFDENWKTIWRSEQPGAQSSDVPEDWRIEKSVEVQSRGAQEFKINLIMAKLVVPMNAECISISTDASLKEMLPPAALVRAPLQPPCPSVSGLQS
jgi:hypothetical protein